MNRNIEISERDDIDTRPLTAEERLPQVREMLASLIAGIDGLVETDFFSEPAPKLTAEEVTARIAKIEKFARTGEI